MALYLLTLVLKHQDHHTCTRTRLAFPNGLTKAELDGAEKVLLTRYPSAHRVEITGATRLDDGPEAVPQPALHFNPPSALPGVGSMLILLIGEAHVLAQREEYCKIKDGNLQFYLPGGGVLVGRFPWTYA